MLHTTIYQRDKMYKVVEIFEAIQGEGYHAGTPCVFVRFFGCNLECDFGSGFKCDEALHSDKTKLQVMSGIEIIKACKSQRHVVITGGEPSLYELNELIAELKSRGHYVQVETNGLNFKNIREASWITYSPKVEWSSDRYKIEGFDELKLLAEEGSNIPVDTFYNTSNKYIQPISKEHELDSDNIKWCVRWLLHHNGWKLSLQTHKAYGGR